MPKILLYTTILLLVLGCTNNKLATFEIQGYSIGDSIDIDTDTNIIIEHATSGVDDHGEELVIAEFSHFRPDPRLSFYSKNYNIVGIFYEKLVEEEYQSLLVKIHEIVEHEPEIYHGCTRSGIKIIGDEHIYFDSISGFEFRIGIDPSIKDSMYFLQIHNSILSEPIYNRYKIEEDDTEYEFTIIDD